ncbi:hypothetical protein MIR68_011492 [Amoeboaphelidium protococcarum]|nr:hypothetical protein MIR68_011492 [Amoeboaphelidium protococcarum]
MLLEVHHIGSQCLPEDDSANFRRRLATGNFSNELKYKLQRSISKTVKDLVSCVCLFRWYTQVAGDYEHAWGRQVRGRVRILEYVNEFLKQYPGHVPFDPAPRNADQVWTQDEQVSLLGRLYNGQDPRQIALDIGRSPQFLCQYNSVIVVDIWTGGWFEVPI